MPFQKGESGNAGGRPHKSQQQKDFEVKCRDWSALHAFNKLKDYVDHEEPKVFMWAVSELLNRGFGKAVETQVIEANVTAQTGSTTEEFNERLSRLTGGSEAGSKPVDGGDGVDGGK